MHHHWDLFSIKPPSVSERINNHSNHLHTYGESTAVQEIFHLCECAKTKNSLKDENDEKC